MVLSFGFGRALALFGTLGFAIASLPARAQPVLDELADEGPGHARARDDRPRGAPPSLTDQAYPSPVAAEPAPAVGHPARPAPASEALGGQPDVPALTRPRTSEARGAKSGSARTVAEGKTQAREPTPRFAPLEPVRVGGLTYYPYSFDGHVHSSHSPDADHPPLELLAGAERAGLSALVITDHGSAASRQSFAKYKGPVVPLVGQEIGGPFGHAVWWNVDAALPPHPSRASLAERAAFAHERGGLIVLCHPGWWIGGREQDPMGWITPEALQKGGLSGDIDALELWNGVYDAPLPKLLAAWVSALEAGVFVPIVGNSDFHRFRAHRLGGPRNVALCAEREPAHCMFDAIKRGRSYVSDGPTLHFAVGDKTMGDTVRPAGSALQGQLEAVAPRGGELRLYLGRSLLGSWPLRAGQRESIAFSAPAPSAPTYLRVEIVRAYPGRETPIFELLSNPIRVTP